MAHLRKLRLFLAVAAAAAVTSTVSAQNFNEIGDAGSSASTAQSTGAGGTLTSISGNIFGLGDGDFYLINILNPATFSATTVGGTSLDTQIYLFSLSGSPIFLNDDDAGGLSLQSTLPAGSASLLGPGVYILGISLSGVDPVNILNQALFAAAQFSTDLRGPALGVNGPVTGVFNNTGFADSGNYVITLTGAGAIPEPSSVVLLAAGGLAGAAFLRRRFAASH